MRLCDKQLARWYREFNRKWFDGRLPDDTDVLYAPYEGACGLVWHEEGSFIIQINPAYAVDSRMVKFTLLHELCHIALHPDQSHGRAFQTEMKRLATSGAFKGIW